MCQRFGIDVSHWQGNFNFANAKNKEGVEFAIIKAGGGDAGLYKDSRFEDNYRKFRVCNRNKWNNWPFDNVDKIHDDNMVNLYAFYVLEIALRIAVLEVIGVNVSDDVKNYVMDEHLDWIKLEKHLDEDCVLPMNVFRQMIEKLQNPT